MHVELRVGWMFLFARCKNLLVLKYASFKIPFLSSDTFRIYFTLLEISHIEITRETKTKAFFFQYVV